MDPQPHTGFVIWITGMNASGKTALGTLLARRIALAARPVELIDADDEENPLTRGLGGTREDRDAAVRRVGYTAKLVARAGGVAVVAALSPYREPREILRREVRRFVEVFTDCAIETLQKRNPIYRKALAGEVKNVPGIDAPYEPPSHPDLIVRTDQETLEDAAKKLFQLLVDVKYLTPAEFGRVTGGERPKRARPAARRSDKRARGGRSKPKLAAKATRKPKKTAARAKRR
jgi:adenylyl-sulfate kinase